MAADIGQRHNIADSNPETVIALNTLLESIHGDTPPAGHDPIDVCSF